MAKKGDHDRLARNRIKLKADSQTVVSEIK